MTLKQLLTCSAAALITLAAHANITVLSTDWAATLGNKTVGSPGANRFTLNSGVYSYNFNAGATSDMLVLALSAEKSNESFTVSYGGQAMSLAVQASFSSGASIYYLANPSPTGTIEIDFSGVGTVNGFGIAVASLHGNGAAILLDSTAARYGASSIDITTTTGDAFVLVGADANSENGSPTMGNPLATITTNSDVGSSQVGFGYENAVAADTHTYSWAPQANARGMAAAAFVTNPSKGTVIMISGVSGWLLLLCLGFTLRKGIKRDNTKN